MINFKEFENIYNQVNDANLPSMLDTFCQKLTERIQSERDQNAYAYKAQMEGVWHVVIKGSDHDELYAITHGDGGYSFIRVFVR